MIQEGRLNPGSVGGARDKSRDQPPVAEFGLESSGMHPIKSPVVESRHMFVWR